MVRRRPVIGGGEREVEECGGDGERMARATLAVAQLFEQTRHRLALIGEDANYAFRLSEREGTLNGGERRGERPSTCNACASTARASTRTPSRCCASAACRTRWAIFRAALAFP